MRAFLKRIYINTDASFIAINLVLMCYHQHKTFSILGGKRSI